MGLEQLNWNLRKQRPGEKKRTNMPRAAGTNLQSDLDNLAKSKALLASAIDIVRYLERIQRSLETVAVLGADAHRIPADAKRFFLKLGNKVTQLPAHKLRAYLAKLDELIRADLDRIVAIADGAASPDLLDDASALFGLDEDAVKKLINEFERRTRTSVSMRVLMIRRGLQVEVLVIPIAEEMLQQRIEKLDEREKECTGVVQNEIVAMRDDIDLILSSHQCGEALQQQLQVVREELEQNLEHLRAGKSIDALPFPFEVAEATDAGAGTWAKPAPAPEPEPEPEPEPAPAGNVEPAPAEDLPARGFFGTLWIYCTTPNHVTWQMARTYRKGS